MFRQGMLRVSGEEYMIYIVDEPKLYRMDICRKGTPFHVRPEGVLYSEYRKRKRYVYGDSEYKNKILAIQNKLTLLKVNATHTPKWGTDGSFYMNTTKKESETLQMTTIEKDGMVYIETYIDGKDLYAVKTMSDTALLISEPVNSSNYTEDILNINNNIASSNEESPYIPLYELEKRYNLRHLKSKDYGYIHSVDEGRAYLERAKQAARERVLVGLDIESTGLEMNLYGKDRMVGLIISAYPDEARYFGFAHNNSYNLPDWFIDEIIEALLEIQEMLLAHNKKFDRKGFTKRGYDLRIQHDSMLLSFLCDPKIEKGAHALKKLVYIITKNRFLEFEDIFTDPNNINFADLPEDLIVAYACPDADNTRVVWEAKWKQLPRVSRKIYYTECALADLKSDQEYWGFRVDIEHLVEEQKVCKETIDMLEKAIKAIARKSDLNVNSPEVLADLLYNKMKCPVLMTTKSGRPSTSSKALNKLAGMKLDEPKNLLTQNLEVRGNTVVKAKDLNASRYPLIVLLVEYRKYIKLNTAFYERIVKNSYDAALLGMSCARYFSWINQNGASSGRQSSPLHQLPKAIKKGILADSDDHYLVDTDFSQIELRLIFSLAKEIELVRKACDPRIDIHRAIQFIIAHKPIWSISAEERQMGKSRNFGVVYLISGRGLAVNMFGAGATDEQVKICEAAIDEFYKAFKRIGAYIRKNEQQVLTDGYMMTKFGRFKYFYEIKDPDISKEKKASLIRMANNLPVQGTAADLMKMAENQIQIAIRERGWDKLVDTPQGRYPLVRCMLSIHDEPLVSAHRSIPVEEILDMLRKAMEIPVGNVYIRKHLDFTRLNVRKYKRITVRPIETDEEEYNKVMAMEATHINKEPFAPLFSCTSIADNWKEGHGGTYEVPRELCTRLIRNYKRTGISKFDNWAKKEIKGVDEDTTIEVYNLKDQILKSINDYRDESIINYMEDLIKEHNSSDPTIISEYVRDDVLTHDLIGRFKQSDEEVKKNGKLSHMESILYATEKYMKFREGLTLNEIVEKEEKDDYDIQQFFSESTSLGAELVEVTPDGEYIYSEALEEEDIEVSYFKYDDEFKEIDKLTVSISYYCYKIEDMILLDFTKILNQSTMNTILAKVYESNVSTGFYPVYMIYNNEYIDTGMRVEELDENILNDYIRELVEKELSQAS